MARVGRSVGAPWQLAGVAVVALLMLLAAGGCTGAGRALRPAASAASADPGVTGSGPASASGATVLPLRPVRSTVRLTVGGVSRTALLYVPPSVSGAGRLPLLVALYGGGGSAAHFEATSGFDALAAADGFVVAYPQALTPGGRTASWNAGGCCGFAARTDVDDVGFVEQLVAGLAASGRIDRGRIFAAGESNGGMLAYRLACQASAVFAAIGVQSATLEYANCDLGRPVSLLHIHGTAYENVPLAGGRGSAGPDQVDYTAPLAGAAMLARADGCGATPAAGTSADYPDAAVYSWAGCPDGTAVRFVAVQGMGHSWQDSSAKRIWQFLAGHARAG